MICLPGKSDPWKTLVEEALSREAGRMREPRAVQLSGFSVGSKG